jgi:hypothetical protein
MIERVGLRFPKDGIQLQLLKGRGAPMLMRIFQSLPALGLRGVAISGRRGLNHG